MLEIIVIEGKIHKTLSIANIFLFEHLILYACREREGEQLGEGGSTREKEREQQK